MTVAGHQCQFEVDYPKPTRLFSDLPGVESFGKVGWPQISADGEYLGPLPRDCGHNHRAKTFGPKAEGGFHSTSKAVYPHKCAVFWRS